MSTLKLSVVGLGSRAIFMVVNVIGIILLARYLEPKGRGEYFLFQTVLSVLTIVADCGLSQSANVFAARYPEHAKQIHGALLQSVCIVWLGALPIVGGIFIWGRDWFLPNLPTVWVWVAFGTLPMTVYTGMWNGMMVGLGEIWQMNIVQLWMTPLQLILIVVLVVVFSGGVATAISIYVFTMLIQCCTMFLLIMGHRRETSSASYSGKLIREMWVFAIRGYANAVASLLWTRAPVFVLNLYHGVGPVGIFSAAQQLAEKILLPIQALQDAIYRKMALFKEGEATVAMNRYLRLVASGMLIIVLVGTVLAGPVVVLLFGHAYDSATQVFRLLIVGVAFVGTSLVLSAYLLSHLRRPGLLSILASANLIVSFSMSRWLIPDWAEMGAASALVVTQAAGTLVGVACYLRLAGTQLRDAFLPNKDDMLLMREQIGTVLSWTRAKA